MKLKIFILTNFLVIIACLVSQNEAFMEDKILQFVEELRKRMCHPLFGYPALDPFQVEHANYSIYKESIVNLTSSITDLYVIGLSDLNVTNLKIVLNPLKRSSFEVVLPSTVAKSLYTAKGSIAFVKLTGDGNAEVNVDNFELSISWSMKLGSKLGIRKLKIEASIGKLWINFENLFEEPLLNDFFHALINEMGIELLNDIWVEAQERGFIKYVENMINNILGNYTLSEIANIIGGLGESEKPPFGDAPADCKTNILI